MWREVLFASSALFVTIGYLASTEAVASYALWSLTEDSYSAPRTGDEKSIVFLTGGLRWRLPKAAEWQKRTGLPLIVSGRNTDYYLKRLNQLGARAIWVEGHSTDTEQNAAYVSCIALRYNIEPVFLITDSAHMRRAIGWFRHYGIQATPVSSGPPFPGQSTHRWLPSEIGLKRTIAAIHEWLGLAELELARARDWRLSCPAGDVVLPFQMPSEQVIRSMK
jgi:uncharacterized SAM-binding protein YcdF (DUF218 family)